MKFRVSKNNSYDLGLAWLCVNAAALTRPEFNQWIYWVIENSEEELPLYIFELLEIGVGVGDFYRTVGFAPSSGLSDEEMDAVSGIAYKRGVYDKPLTYDVHISREDALKALAENPHIEERFRETFPFIEY